METLQGALHNLRFGPAVRGTRQSELARLPFVSTVQDYFDRFNAVLCHAHNLSAPQKAKLFVSGLPKHIKFDIELWEPQSLRTAMYLARAFECRVAATLLVSVQQTTSPSQRQPLALPAPAAQMCAPDPAAAIPPLPVPRQAPALALFRRLMPTEMLEHCRQGLCFNCDELYMRGHQCQRLFFLKVIDFLSDALVDNDGAKEALRVAPKGLGFRRCYIGAAAAVLLVLYPDLQLKDELFVQTRRDVMANV